MAESCAADTVESPVPAPPAGRPAVGRSSLVELEVAALSHPGKVRPDNEDHYLVGRFDRAFRPLLTTLPAGSLPEATAETAYVLLVADGMGGHAAGEVASRTAVEVLVDLVLETPGWLMRLDDEGIREVIRRMDRRLRLIADALAERALADARLFRMGTTMTVACSLGEDLLLTHVGDSRAYLFRGGELRRLTKDQTLAQDLADRGYMPPEAVASHPLRHSLTSALSADRSPARIDFDQVRLEDGDVILLCTDGLTEMVPDAALAEALRRAGPVGDACQTLVDQALAAGGKDNVTVILGRYRLPDEGS